MEIPWFSLNDIDVGQRLGAGKFGSVYVARCRRTGFIFALKVLAKNQLVKHRVEHQLRRLGMALEPWLEPRREIEIQSHCRHVNILRLYTWFYDEKRVYLCLEMAPGGELYGLLQSRGTFSEAQTSTWIAIQCALPPGEVFLVLQADGGGPHRRSFMIESEC